MAVHKILEDLYEPTYSLIAIHSHLEDYRLAYFLNQLLKAKFKKIKQTIDFDKDVSYGIFEWDDLYQDTVWSLISNTSIVQVHREVTTDLFADSKSSVTNYLIPEYKNVDYFIKIDNGDFFKHTDSTIKKINEITQITMAYQVSPDELKSKNNLIF